MLDKDGVRQADIIDFRSVAAETGRGTRHRLARAQNFCVELIEADGEAPAFELASDDEMMLLMPGNGALISGLGQEVTVAARSICITPPGSYSVRLQAGFCCVLATTRQGRAPDRTANAQSYEPADPRVAPIGAPYLRRTDPRTIRVYDIDRIQAPGDNPRLKLLQSATMSINWVEYEGPRDRTALSPHAHKDFEQGSLALSGDFVHHLRTEWGKNAELWRDDVHARVPSPSLLVVPPQTIHTTEGVGAGHHLLIDIFAPPRLDFMAKSWIANAAEYAAPNALPAPAA